MQILYIPGWKQGSAGAYAGANFYDCDKVIVMTNTTFTRSATQLAEKLEVELWPQLPYLLPFYGYCFKNHRII